TGQILNTGGFDTVNGLNGTCIGGNNANNTPGGCNESLQWRDIGTANFTNPGGNTPEPSTIVLLITGAAGLTGFARRCAA
ncbi:MAG: PEP-CTERM sorting domain-containing protein, partial [Candidatus Acidiferrales bacterium]